MALFVVRDEMKEHEKMFCCPLKRTWLNVVQSRDRVAENLI